MTSGRGPLRRSARRAAAGMALLNVIEGEDLVGNAGKVGAMLKEGLQGIVANARS